MFLSALILGLLGSVHCLGMCGPIAFMLPVSQSHLGKKTAQIAIYHFGKLLAYTLIGLVFGAIGKSLYIFGWQQYLSVAIGSLMIILVVVPQNLIRRYNFSKPIFKTLSRIKTALGTALKQNTMDTFLTIGFLNGFLPCGLVYMAVFAALNTGSISSGGLYMFVFGLGTIPLMTFALYAIHLIKENTRQYLQKRIPLVVILIGSLFIIRGLGLEIPYLSPAPVHPLVTHTLGCH